MSELGQRLEMERKKEREREKEWMREKKELINEFLFFERFALSFLSSFFSQERQREERDKIWLWFTVESSIEERENVKNEKEMRKK